MPEEPESLAARVPSSIGKKNSKAKRRGEGKGEKEMQTSESSMQGNSNSMGKQEVAESSEVGTLHSPYPHRLNPTASVIAASSAADQELEGPWALYRKQRIPPEV
ncbi:hypothetical protein EON64_13100 [archaeon]|nr:MAG: hypothetical protein EON64_13100 [archaeon]